jgi:hypothetical protein
VIILKKIQIKSMIRGLDKGHKVVPYEFWFLFKDEKKKFELVCNIEELIRLAGELNELFQLKKENPTEKIPVIIYFGTDFHLKCFEGSTSYDENKEVEKFTELELFGRKCFICGKKFEVEIDQFDKYQKKLEKLRKDANHIIEKFDLFEIDSLNNTKRTITAMVITEFDLQIRDPYAIEIADEVKRILIEKKFGVEVTGDC